MDKEQETEKLFIQMFAHFQVIGMGSFLDEDSIRSDMLIKLFAYIAFHSKREITTQELVEVLWHDEESDNPAGALKNLVYRLRTLLKKKWPEYDFIITGRGSYRWNQEVPIETDIEEFENCCKKASTEKMDDKRIEIYLKAVSLYKGAFLPKFSGEYWITSLSTYYHSMYLSLVKEAAEFFEQAGKYEEMGQVCGNALQMDNLDESLHCYFIKALIHQNKLKLAAEQYKKATDILYENLGVSPSKELRDVYEELLKQTHEEEKSIDAIKRELDDDDDKGAFLCEYGVFKKTYHLEKRRAERMGISVYLSLITVVPSIEIKQDSQAYLNIVNEGMEKLEDVLIHSLRSGDVIAKYSGSQYVVLLPTCQYETAKMVMKRIENAFILTSKKKVKVKLQYSLDEMGFRCED